MTTNKDSKRKGVMQSDEEVVKLGKVKSFREMEQISEDWVLATCLISSEQLKRIPLHAGHPVGNPREAIQGWRCKGGVTRTILETPELLPVKHSGVTIVCKRFGRGSRGTGLDLVEGALVDGGQTQDLLKSLELQAPVYLVARVVEVVDPADPMWMNLASTVNAGAQVKLLSEMGSQGYFDVFEADFGEKFQTSETDKRNHPDRIDTQLLLQGVWHYMGEPTAGDGALKKFRALADNLHSRDDETRELAASRYELVRDVAIVVHGLMRHIQEDSKLTRLIAKKIDGKRVSVDQRQRCVVMPTLFAYGGCGEEWTPITEPDRGLDARMFTYMAEARKVNMDAYRRHSNVNGTFQKAIYQDQLDWRTSTGKSRNK